LDFPVVDLFPIGKAETFYYDHFIWATAINHATGTRTTPGSNAVNTKAAGNQNNSDTNKTMGAIPLIP